jgi:hypothetical protein
MIRWVGHWHVCARNEKLYEGKNHLEDLGMDEKIILEWILK